MSRRIYKVSVFGPEQVREERLVEAGTPAQAVRHVSRHLIAAEVARQADIVRLLESGSKVEQAGKAAKAVHENG